MKLATQEQLTHGKTFVDKFKDIGLATVSPASYGIAGKVLSPELQPRGGGKKPNPQASVVSDDPVAGFDPKTGGQVSVAVNFKQSLLQVDSLQTLRPRPPPLPFLFTTAPPTVLLGAKSGLGTGARIRRYSSEERTHFSKQLAEHMGQDEELFEDASMEQGRRVRDAYAVPKTTKKPKKVVHAVSLSALQATRQYMEALYRKKGPHRLHGEE